MSGGGEKAIYRLSLGYRKEEGTTIGTGMERINVSFNVNYKFSNRLDIQSNFIFSNTDKEANWDNPRGHAYNKMPNMSPYYMDVNNNRTGEYFTPESNFQGSANIDSDKETIKTYYNPVAMAKESINKSTGTDSRFSFELHYNILKGLDYRGTVGLKLTKNKNKKYLPGSVTGLSWRNT